MTTIRRRPRTIVDALMDLAIRFVDAVDAEKLLTPEEKKALKAPKVTNVDVEAQEIEK